LIRLSSEFFALAVLAAMMVAGCSPVATPTDAPTDPPSVSPAPKSASPTETQPKHILWEVAGKTNQVYLLGSVHLLREDDYPLPAIYGRVYDEAEKLVMELDMDDIDLLQMQQQMITAGMTTDGRSLQQILGETQWRKASAMAESMDIELEMLNSVEPWFAALTVVELQMLKLGFDPSLGVEFHFLRRAQADSKPIEGLESVAQQITFFDRLPLETQSRFFLKALEDAQTIDEGIEDLINAWRSGNTAAMHDELTEGFDGFPTVYDSLVVRRNQAWVRNIADLLDDEDDYLVIVGALHLIGDDSVVGLLSAQGYSLKQL